MSVDESLKQNFESINTEETNRMIYEVLIHEDASIAKIGVSKFEV